jgi:hypothetical protein
MKKLTFLLTVFLLSWPFLSRAQNPPTNVDVKLKTPGGQVEVTNQPPPPVIVVPPQPAQKIVVEKPGYPPPPPPPPPPNGGCHCNLVQSPVLASGFLNLAPIFSLLFVLSWRKKIKNR